MTASLYTLAHEHHMTTNKQHTKYIFITGGVVSSLGKGIVAASLGALLEKRGLKIALSKADPYINVDPGTMSPFQHGEVFVTDDGAETDLDMGHYERFTRANFTRKNSFSSGQVYDEVLSKERKGDYLGATVQVVPHITEQIKSKIFRASQDVDVSIIEIGGTVGDIESLPYLETIRQMRYELGSQNVLCIHLTLVPYIAAVKELKTKPTQHSVKELRSIGIQPDILVCRAEREIPIEIREKIALFCNVPKGHVFEACDLASIYEMPLILHKQGLDEKAVEFLNIWTRKPELHDWKQIVERLQKPKDRVKIAIVGKYTGVVDSYKSVEEALIHGGIKNNLAVDISYIDAENLTSSNLKELLAPYKGVIVPGGFGERGVEGKLLAIQYVRENKIPFLGICLGLQLACIEFARNILELKNANSLEFSKDSPYEIITLMSSQKEVTKKGGTMRLGAYDCRVQPGTSAFKAYSKENITERHRHRYEFNNQFRTSFEANGMIFSGLSPDAELIEILELKDHPFFIACQFHPELKSKPIEPHPLFSNLVSAAYQLKNFKRDS